MYRDEMTPRGRWLAALDMRPVDRLPFWPKIFPGYSLGQTGRFREMSVPELHAYVGSDPHISLPDGLRMTRTRTAVEVNTEGHVRRTVYRTPHGELNGEDHFDVPSQSWHPVIFPVRTAADIATMQEIYDDTQVEVDAEKLAQARAQASEVGERGVTTGSIGESPLMTWIEYTAGVANGHYLLADHRAAVEALFEAHHRVLLCRTELMAATHPADFLYFIENTSTTLISPAQYRLYCLRHITEYGNILRAARRRLVLHMCGHLKLLLPTLAGLPAVAFEAYTSPPLGNTTLLDGRQECPDKCLVGGTNAILWTRSAREIIAELERDLDELPHHRGLVVTSAGVMTPLCRPETVKTVGDWVKAYPARM
jgi:uroporphyrinogen-III decarboxylase